MKLTELTPEQKRIAIAEACGIAVIPCTCTASPWKDAATSKHIPDYLNDLNAMASAEKTVFGSSTLWLDFSIALMRVLECAEMSELDGMTCVLQSTAAQRADAFLIAIGRAEL
jgi:hypothetical protein